MSDDLALLPLALMELQRRRRFLIKTEMRLSHAAGAYARLFLGWSKDLPEREVTRIKTEAARLVRAVRDGEAADSPIVPDLKAMLEGIAPAAAQRHRVELEMARIARRLPAYDHAKAVRGFGDLAFAVIVGEAGDLGNYATVSRLWRRLGLAPYAGKAGIAWRIGGGLSAADWTDYGYVGRRRAEVYSCLDEPLFRQQTMVNGPYRAVYDARRARTAETHPDWPKWHSHGDALRVMSKQAIADLWSAWRRAVSQVEAKDWLPAADQSAQAGGEAKGTLISSGVMSSREPLEEAAE